MKNLKVSMKLLVAFGTVLVLMLIIVGVAVIGLNSVAGGLELFYTKPFTNVTSAEDLLMNLQNGSKNMLHACLTQDKDETQKRLQMANEAFNALDSDLGILKNSYMGDKNHLTAIEGGVSQVRSFFDEFQVLASNNDIEGAFELYNTQMLTPLQAIDANIKNVLEYTNSVATKTYADGRNTSNFCSVLMIAVGILSILVGIAMATYITRALVSCIGELRESARLMSEGNFDAPLTYHSKDELGELSHGMRMMTENVKAVIEDAGYLLGAMAAGNFNIKTKAEQNYVGAFRKLLLSMRELNTNLSDALGQIDQSADQVASGSDQVSSGAQALSQGATEQASSVEELAATINEISTQVKKTASHALEARDKTNQSGQEVDVCNRQMQEMVAAMADITEKSNEIGKIIKTIEDIAFQTNILALNAAVEAARAGVAGKGFAVVADEVRSLASKAAEASKNTSSLIEGAIHAVESGTNIANDTAQSLQRVVESAQATLSIVDSISSASNEQASSIAQVTQGVEQISNVVQTNSATAQQSAAASEELSGQAQVLKNLVRRFQLKNRGNAAPAAGQAGVADMPANIPLADGSKY